MRRLMETETDGKVCMIILCRFIKLNEGLGTYFGVGSCTSSSEPLLKEEAA